MITVIVEVYKDRTARPPLEFKTIGQFRFDEKELLAYPESSCMYEVLSRKLRELGFNYPLQFWSGEKHGVITACLDDRNHYDY